VRFTLEALLELTALVEILDHRGGS